MSNRKPFVSSPDDDPLWYEVLGYETQDDFDHFESTLIADGVIFSEEALEIGRDELANFPIIKVQSSDREEIWVIRRENQDAA